MLRWFLGGREAQGSVEVRKERLLLFGTISNHLFESVDVLIITCLRTDFKCVDKAECSILRMKQFGNSIAIFNITVLTPIEVQKCTSSKLSPPKCA